MVISNSEYIRQHLSKSELLAQLAEESAELAQAALKLRRAIDGVNPTPVSEEQAVQALLEEYGDVMNCIDCIITVDQDCNVMRDREKKLHRWVTRLREAQNEATE